MPARRHHRAAAGISVGSGPLLVEGIGSRAATSAPARAASSRWVASRGQNGSAVMWGSMVAASARQGSASAPARVSSASRRRVDGVLDDRRSGGGAARGR